MANGANFDGAGSVCQPSIGYRNDNPIGLVPDLVPSDPTADLIKMGTLQCDMVAYDIAVYSQSDIGQAVIETGFHTALGNVDPINDFLIEGTRNFHFISFTDLDSVEIVHAEFDQPVQIPREFYFVIRTTSNLFRPVNTCQPANFGKSEDGYFIFDGQNWQPGDSGNKCFSNLYLKIWCAGDPPYADFNRDGVVNLIDHDHFIDCMNGPGVNASKVPALEPLRCFDTDGDCDVDLKDYQLFERELTKQLP